MALDLAAGGLRNTAGFDERDSLDGQFVLGRHFPADAVVDLVERIQIALPSALEFMHDHQPLATPDLDRDGRTGPRT